MNDSMDYWLAKAEEIRNMIAESADDITVSFEIAAYIRRFYVKGKRDGVEEYNNTPRY